MPKGVKRVDQVSWFLHEAISHGLSIMSWFENYMAEELPSENLWDDAEAIEEHFRRLRDKKSSGSSSDSSGDDGSEMMQNDLASVFKQ